MKTSLPKQIKLLYFAIYYTKLLTATKKERNIGLDLIKIIACVLVIALHTCSNYDLTKISDWPNFVVYNFAAIAIPTFFVVNGALLIGKDLTTTESLKYIWKKILKTAFICIVFIYGYELIQQISGNGFRMNAISDVIIRQKGPFFHFWFFISLIIIYIAYPLLNYIYRKNKKLFITFTLALIGLQLAMDLYTLHHVAFLNVQCQNTLLMKIPQSLRIFTYFPYFMLGGILKEMKPVSKKWIFTGITAMLIYILCIDRLIYHHDGTCEIFYNNILMIAVVAMLFTNFYHTGIAKKNSRELVSTLAPSIMIVYILHPLLIKPYDNLFPNPIMQYGIVKLAVIAAVTFAAAYWISKVKILRKFFKL